MDPLANAKIQGLFKAFECFSSTFQGKFYFQGLLKTVLYIQVLFKPVRTLNMYVNRGKCGVAALVGDVSFWYPYPQPTSMGNN